jgi:hypothetical protein
MQVFIKRFERDDEEIREIEGHVRVFLEEVEETTRKLKSKYGE